MPRRKTAKKRGPKRAPTVKRGGKALRCKYTASFGKKAPANKLAGQLKRDGFRPLVSKTYGGGRVGYSVFSCPKPARARRRKRR